MDAFVDYLVSSPSVWLILGIWAYLLVLLVRGLARGDE